MRKPSTINTNGSSAEGFRPLCLRNDSGSRRHESTSLIMVSMWSASSTQREQESVIDFVIIKKYAIKSEVLHEHFLINYLNR